MTFDDCFKAAYVYMGKRDEASASLARSFSIQRWQIFLFLYSLNLKGKHVKDV